MYTPISCEFFDQLNVAMKRNIPSTIVYLENNEKKTIKGLIQRGLVNKEKLIELANDAINVGVGFNPSTAKHNLTLVLEHFLE